MRRRPLCKPRRAAVVRQHIRIPVALWSLRLAAYLTWRNHGAGEDYRYRFAEGVESLPVRLADGRLRVDGELREGDTLDQALENGLEDLDGFYTFAVGTRDGFAVLRDPFGCKPAVMAETDDWVAMSSEYRAIAQLPNSKNARIWEPEPAQIYSWERN